MIEVRRSEEQRAVRRSISGSEDYDFTLILYSQVVAALWRENSDSDERQRDAAFAAMTNMQPHDALEGMLIAQQIARVLSN